MQRPRDTRLEHACNTGNLDAVIALLNENVRLEDFDDRMRFLEWANQCVEVNSKRKAIYAIVGHNHFRNLEHPKSKSETIMRVGVPLCEALYEDGQNPHKHSLIATIVELMSEQDFDLMLFFDDASRFVTFCHIAAVSLMQQNKYELALKYLDEALLVDSSQEQSFKLEALGILIRFKKVNDAKLSFPVRINAAYTALHKLKEISITNNAYYTSQLLAHTQDLTILFSQYAEWSILNARYAEINKPGEARNFYLDAIKANKHIVSLHPAGSQEAILALRNIANLYLIVTDYCQQKFDLTHEAIITIQSLYNTSITLLKDESDPIVSNHVATLIINYARFRYAVCAKQECRDDQELSKTNRLLQNAVDFFKHSTADTDLRQLAIAYYYQALCADELYLRQHNAEHRELSCLRLKLAFNTIQNIKNKTPEDQRMLFDLQNSLSHIDVDIAGKRLVKRKIRRCPSIEKSGSTELMPPRKINFANKKVNIAPVPQQVPPSSPKIRRQNYQPPISRPTLANILAPFAKQPVSPEHAKPKFRARNTTGKPVLPKVEDDIARLIKFIVNIFHDIEELIVAEQVIMAKHPLLFQSALNSFLFKLCHGLLQYVEPSTPCADAIQNLYNKLFNLPANFKQDYVNEIKNFIAIFSEPESQLRLLHTNPNLRDLFCSSLNAVSKLAPVQDCKHNPIEAIQAIGNKLKEILDMVAFLSEGDTVVMYQNKKITIDWSGLSEDVLGAVIASFNTSFQQVSLLTAGKIRNIFANLSIGVTFNRFAQVSQQVQVLDYTDIENLRRDSAVLRIMADEMINSPNKFLSAVQTPTLYMQPIVASISSSSSTELSSHSSGEVSSLVDVFKGMHIGNK